MTKLEQILEQYPDEDLEVATGFDEAIIGVSDTFSAPKIVYSVTKCLEILETEHGMSPQDAMEYFDFNVSGGYIGEKTPIWCDDRYDDEGEPSQKLIDAVIEIIKTDINAGDETAIDELLKFLPVKYLVGFLPEPEEWREDA